MTDTTDINVLNRKSFLFIFYIQILTYLLLLLIGYHYDVIIIAVLVILLGFVFNISILYIIKKSNELIEHKFDEMMKKYNIVLVNQKIMLDKRNEKKRK